MARARFLVATRTSLTLGTRCRAYMSRVESIRWALLLMSWQCLLRLIRVILPMTGIVSIEALLWNLA